MCGCALSLSLLSLVQQEMGSDNKMPTHLLQKKRRKNNSAVHSGVCSNLRGDGGSGDDRRDGQTIKCANIRSVH